MSMNKTVNVVPLDSLLCTKRISIKKDPMRHLYAIPELFVLFTWVWRQLVGTRKGYRDSTVSFLRTDGSSSAISKVDQKRQALASILLDLFYYDAVALSLSNGHYTRSAGNKHVLKASLWHVPEWYNRSDLVQFVVKNLQSAQLICVLAGYPEFKSGNGQVVKARLSRIIPSGVLKERLSVLTLQHNFLIHDEESALGVNAQSNWDEYLSDDEDRKDDHLIMSRHPETGLKAPFFHPEGKHRRIREKLKAINTFNETVRWTAYTPSAGDVEILAQHLKTASTMEASERVPKTSKAPAKFVSLIGYNNQQTSRYSWLPHHEPMPYLGDSQYSGQFHHQTSAVYEDVPVARLSGVTEPLWLRSGGISLPCNRKRVDTWQRMTVIPRASENSFGRIYWEMTNRKRLLRYSLRAGASATVELDFRNLHSRMLYASVSRDYRGDLYNDICLKVGDTENILRPLAKNLLNAMINATNEHDAIAAVNREMWQKSFSDASVCKQRAFLKELCGVDNVKVLAPALLEVHAPIAHLLHHDQGVHLMAREAEIALEIMYRMITRHAASCLSIHDGFITANKNANTLTAVMKEVTKEHLGFEIDVAPAY